MNEITYNGKNLSDFGVYYDSHSAFGSPERDVELVEVAGKDGALIIDNDRFKNIDLTFPCYINTNFLAQYRNALAYLQSCKGYNRLEYTQEPNHFRMASFNMGSQPTPNQFHKSGQFPVVFNCKPQRFLKSGETPVSSQSQDEEYEGNPVSINNPSGLSTVTSLEVGLSPIQNLNGYEYPWVGGAGKNLFNKDGTFSHNGTSHVATSTGVTITTTTTGNNKNASTEISSAVLGQTVTISANVTRSSTNNGNIRLYFCDANNTIVGSSISSTSISSDGAVTITATIPATFPEGATKIMIWLYGCTTGTTGTGLSVTYNDLMLEIGSTASAYEPYENICPIYGANERNLFDEANAEVYARYIDTSAWKTTEASSYLFPCKPSTEYTVSAYNYNLTIFRVGCLNQTFDPSSSADYPLTHVTRKTSATSITFTTDANTQYIVVQVNSAYVHNGMVQIEEGDTPTAYQPYHNISVERTGKNLLKIDSQSLSKPYFWATNWDGTIAYGENGLDFRKTFGQGGQGGVWLRVKKGKYTISFDADFSNANGYGFNIRLYDPVAHAIYFNQSPSNLTASHYSYTVEATTDSILLFRPFVTTWKSGATQQCFFNRIMLERSDTESSYEPYTGTTYTTSLGTTVYGGTVDVVSGVLTVTHNYMTINGSETWNTGYWGLGYRYYASGMVNDALNNQMTVNSAFDGVNAQLKIDNATTDKQIDMYVRSELGIFTTKDEFVNYITAHPVEIVYELATPITYQLTPTQVSLLTGVNVISTDGNGDMTITVTEPSLLVNPTLFESKPLLRIYGTGTVNINDKYITISAHSFPYIDIDCELMDAFYGSSNANQYVTFSTNDYITLKSGNNYIAYGNQIEVTPRWFEI